MEIRNAIAIGNGVSPVQSGDIVLGDIKGSVLRVTVEGEIYLNDALIKRDGSIYSSLRTAIGLCISLPPSAPTALSDKKETES